MDISVRGFDAPARARSAARLRAYIHSVAGADFDDDAGLYYLDAHGTASLSDAPDHVADHAHADAYADHVADHAHAD